MPDFMVITDAEGSYDNYTGEDAYKFTDHGMLETVRAESRERRIYSPTAWRYVQDTKPQRRPPGAPIAM